MTAPTCIDSVPMCDQRVAVFSRMPDPHVLAELLCQTVHLHPLDALIAARHTPGLLPTPMTIQQSEHLVSLLSEHGIQAAVVQAADLPDLHDATTVHHARCLGEGFQIFDLRGNAAELLPWAQIAVVAVGCVPGERQSHFVEQGRPSVLSAAPLPEVGRIDTAEHHVLELWLLCRDPVAAYQVRHDRFNYESLSENGTGSATANFEQLARSVVEHSPHAHRTPSTRAFLSRERFGYEFHTSNELQQQALICWLQERRSQKVC